MNKVEIRNSKRDVIKWVIIFTSIILSTTFAQSNFTVTPQLIELELLPGSRKTVKVILVNESETDSNRFRITTADVVEKEDGGYKVIDKGTGKFSCSDWITPDSMEITFGPKQGKELSFDVRAPLKVSGGRYASIVFALIPKVSQLGQNEAGAGVTFHFRIPVQLEITIKSSLTPRPKDVEITGIEIIPATDDKDYSLMLKNAAKNALVVKTTVNNRGDLHIKAKGRLVITDPKGKRLREVPLGAGRGMVLPQTQVKFVSIIKRPLPGNYVAEAILNYGGLTQAIGRIPFNVTRNVQTKNQAFLSSSPIGLTIDKEKIDLFISPNSYRTQILTLTNEENETVKIKSLLKYLSFDENGNSISSDSGDNRFSCINWINLEPNSFEIKPGETKNIKVIVQARDTVPGGRYACLDLQAEVLGAKNPTLPASFLIPILLTIPGKANRQGEITKIDVSLGNPPKLSVYFKNLGNIHLKPKVKIELKLLPTIGSSGDLQYVGEPKSELIGILGFKELSSEILPGGIAKLEQDYNKILDPGNYMAVATADFGASEPAVFIQKLKIK